MKKLSYCLFVFCVFNFSTAFSQEVTYQDLFKHIDKEIDSIITAKLEQQKSNNSLLENVNLKDSTYRHTYEPIGCEGFIKYYYQYDNFGRLIDLIYLDNENQGCEYVDRKISFIYDGLNVIEKQYFKHIPEVEGWVNFLKYDYIYNENDLLIDEKEFIWDELTSVWNQSRDDTYEYDSNDNLTEEVHNRWDEDINDWETFYKLVFEYDLYENVILYEMYRKEQSEQQYEWNDVEINTYTYDSNNFLTENLFKKNWNNEISDWEFVMNTTFINNVNGNPIEELSLKWNFITEAWENYKFITEEYNVNNNILERIYMVWEEDSWLNYLKNNYTYTTGFRLSERINQYWDINNEEWKNDWREIRNYNEFDLIIERLSETWNPSDNSWFTDNTAIYEYDTNLNLIYESSISFTGHGGYSNHYYSEHDISLNTNDNNLQNSVSIIPNPSSEFIAIKGLDNVEQILFYDIGGKLILNTNNHKAIDVSNFQKGLYFVKIASEDSIIVKKFIKN